MRVLLVQPPYTRIRGSGQFLGFPLGLGYLAGSLAAAGFEPVIYSAEHAAPGEPISLTHRSDVFRHRSQAHHNYVAAIEDDQHWTWAELRETLADVRPDLVGVTALSVEFGAAAKICEVVKEWRPDVPIVMGGHHVTVMPEDALRRVPAIDVVVLCEGEETLVELCRAYANGRMPDFGSIPGLAYRADGQVRFSAARSLTRDLDRLPHPRRDVLLFADRFRPHDFGAFISGRGCPFRCSFCSSREFWRKRFRMRSPQDCLAEIRHVMNEHGIQHFMFWDDCFSVNRRAVREFCQAVIDSDLRFTFRTATRADRATDEELLSLLRQAGCVELTLGVESGSPRVLKHINKDLDLDVLSQAIGLIHKHGMAVSTFFMGGFPTETVDDLRQTFDLMRELPVERTTFNIFDPMPGSELYEECIRLGVVGADEDWRNFPLYPDRYVASAMPRDAFDQLVTRIVDFVGSHRRRLLGRVRRAWPKLRTDPRSFLREVLWHMRRR